MGLTAVALGLGTSLGMPFAVLRSSRIQTGEQIGLFGALEPGQAVALLTLWLALAALSLRDGRARRWAAARGLAASAVIVVIAALSGAAATQLGATAGPFARVSVGSGAWAAVAAAYAVVLSARRETGAGGILSGGIALAAPLGVAGLLASGALDGMGMMREYADQGPRFWAEAAGHLTLAAAGAGTAVLLGAALGVLAFRSQRAAKPIFAVAGVVQTVPGLAMIGILVAPLAALSQALPWLRSVGFGGLGWAPVVIALALYGLLPVVRNTYAGLRGAPPETVEAGRGMGMTPWQTLVHVRLPFAAPVISSGVRTAGVQAVGNATLGAFAAAGTLGLFVFGGLAQQATDLIMVGSITIVVLAVLADAALRAVERLLTPRGRTSGR